MRSRVTTGAFVSEETKARARAMRKAPTPAEARVWEWVRDARFGVRVRRQQPIAGFIVDFYVPALHLAIELDGASHEGRGVADAARDEALALRGIRVVHLQNEEATEERLRSLITSPPQPHLPPGEGE